MEIKKIYLTKKSPELDFRLLSKTIQIISPELILSSNSEKKYKTISETDHKKNNQ